MTLDDPYFWILSLLCFTAGFLSGVRYIISVYRKNPSFHFISAEAEVRAAAFMEQLKRLKDK
jgi:hypothetical protein